MIQEEEVKSVHTDDTVHLGLFLFKPGGRIDRQIPLDDEDEQPDNVAVFDPDRNKPHARGPARCVRCRVLWEAVVRFDRRRFYMECPGCHDWTGMFFGGYQPRADQETFTCDCESDLWFILRAGMMLCANCGNEREMPN